MTSLTELTKNTKNDIKKIKKPLSAYQYYNKWMREKWSEMDDQEKEHFVNQAKKDKDIYNEKINEIKEKEKNEIRKRNIFLARSYGHVSSCGLDSGWYYTEVIGPAEGLIEYNKEEQEMYNTKYKSITIADITYTHNNKYFNHKLSLENYSKEHISIIYTSNSRKSKYPNTDYCWSISKYKEESHKRIWRCPAMNQNGVQDIPLSWSAVGYKN